MTMEQVLSCAMTNLGPIHTLPPQKAGNIYYVGFQNGIWYITVYQTNNVMGSNMLEAVAHVGIDDSDGKPFPLPSY